jgi:hypothetical protein
MKIDKPPDPLRLRTGWTIRTYGEPNWEQHQRNGNYCAGLGERRSRKGLPEQMCSYAVIFAQTVSDADRRVPSPQIADFRALLCRKRQILLLNHQNRHRCYAGCSNGESPGRTDSDLFWPGWKDLQKRHTLQVKLQMICPRIELPTDGLRDISRNFVRQESEPLSTTNTIDPGPPES